MNLVRRVRIVLEECFFVEEDWGEKPRIVLAGQAGDVVIVVSVVHERNFGKPKVLIRLLANNVDCHGFPLERLSMSFDKCKARTIRQKGRSTRWAFQLGQSLNTYADAGHIFAEVEECQFKVGGTLVAVDAAELTSGGEKVADVHL